MTRLEFGSEPSDRIVRRVRQGVLVLALLGVLPCANATTYTLTNPDDMVIGEDQTIMTVYEDTLYDLARAYSLGSEELIRVNPKVDPWLPGAGKMLVVPGRHILPPGPHEGIVVNLPEHRLYYYPKPKRGGPTEVITYPVSIGKMDWRTPLGVTHVIQKQKNPTWYPARVRAQGACAKRAIPCRRKWGPDLTIRSGPMPCAWPREMAPTSFTAPTIRSPLDLPSRTAAYACTRTMWLQLFPLIPVGTPVRLINEPVKVAWVDGELLLEAHPPVDAQGQSFEPNIDQFSDLLKAAVGDTTVAINWDYAREVLQKADGVIATVGLEAELPTDSATPAAPPAAPAPATTPPAPAAAAPTSAK